MSCPTCSHTLSCILVGGMERCFQCERCGTVTFDRKDNFHGLFERVNTYVPKLVERCRKFEKKELASRPSQLWFTLGIHESIHTPDKRPEENP